MAGLDGRLGDLHHRHPGLGSLADVAARYFGLLIGADGAADSKPAVMVLAEAIIATMTLICVLGTDISSRLQNMGDPGFDAPQASSPESASDSGRAVLRVGGSGHRQPYVIAYAA